MIDEAVILRVLGASGMAVVLCENGRHIPVRLIPGRTYTPGDAVLVHVDRKEVLEISEGAL